MQEAQPPLLPASLAQHTVSVAWLIVYANCVLSRSLETLAAAGLMTKSDFSLVAHVHQRLGEINLRCVPELLVALPGNDGS